jgi:hypothetical protein
LETFFSFVKSQEPNETEEKRRKTRNENKIHATGNIASVSERLLL